MTMGGLVPGSTMGMVMQGMPAAAMGGQPGVQPNGQYGMAMPQQQGALLPGSLMRNQSFWTILPHRGFWPACSSPQHGTNLTEQARPQTGRGRS